MTGRKTISLIQNVFIHVKRYSLQIYICVFVSVLMFLYIIKTLSLFFGMLSLSSLILIPWILSVKLRNFREIAKILSYLIIIALLCLLVTAVSIIFFSFVSLHDAVVISLLTLLFNGIAAFAYLFFFYLWNYRKLHFLYHCLAVILIVIVSFSYVKPISLLLFFGLSISHSLVSLVFNEKKVAFISIIRILVVAVLVFAGFYLATSIIVMEDTGLLQKDIFTFSFTDAIPLQTEYSFDGSLMYLFKTDEVHLLKGNTYSFYTKKKGFYNTNMRDLPYPASLNNKRWYDFDYINGKLNRKSAQGTLYAINFSDTTLAYNEPFELTKLQPPQNSYVSGALQFSSLVTTYLPIDIQWKTLSKAEYAKYTAYDLDSDSITFIESNNVEKHPFSIIFHYYRMFKKDYRYSLKGEDIASFLITGKKGYCAHFATAFALILRYYGIPCRVVSGFKINPEFKVLDYYKIYDFNAHAWVEIYTDDLGWIPIDPTSDIMAEDEINPFIEPKDDDKEIIEFLLKNEQNFMPYTETVNPDDMESTKSIMNTILSNKWKGIVALTICIVLYLFRYLLYFLFVGLFPGGAKWLSLKIYRSLQRVVQKKYDLAAPTFEDMIKNVPEVTKNIVLLSKTYYSIHFSPKPVQIIGFQFLIHYYICYARIVFGK